MAVDGLGAFAGNHVAQGCQLGIASGIHLARCRQQGRQAVAVFQQILLPADQIHIAQQHLDLATDQQGFERRVVDIDVGNVDFLQCFGMGFDACQCVLYILELALHGQGEGRYTAFHAFEHVHAQQVDQAFLTIRLAEETFAATHLGAVFGVVGRLLVGST